MSIRLGDLVESRLETRVKLGEDLIEMTVKFRAKVLVGTMVWQLSE